MSDAPTCDTDGCDTTVAGLDDGWETGDGALRCAADWAYWERHGHWPDEDVDICVECRVDDGAVRHDCPESAADSVIVAAGDDCPCCGAEVADE